MTRIFCLSALFVVLMCLHPALSEEPARSTAGSDPYAWRDLFDGKSLDGWKVPKFGGEGEVEVNDGTIVIGLGESMTGIAWDGPPLPTVDYEVTLEGMRTTGVDFFATTTFPVNDTFCSFVVGGWGGTVVGLSSIDHADASENQTGAFMSFKNNQWYRIRIRVTKNKIQAWIDDENKVDFDYQGHKINTRFECDLCKPFGVSTWCTEGRIRNLRVRKLTPDEIAEAAPEEN